MTAPLKRLTTQHVRAMHVMLEEGERFGSCAIAASAVGVSEGTVKNWRSDALWMARFREEKEEWEANLRDVPISSARYRQQIRQKQLEGAVAEAVKDANERAAVVRAVATLLKDARDEMAPLVKALPAGEEVQPETVPELALRAAQWLRTLAAKMQRPLEELTAAEIVERLETNARGEPPRSISPSSEE